MANKLGIPLEDKDNGEAKEVEVKPQVEVISKPIERVQKGGFKPYTPKNN